MKNTIFIFLVYAWAALPGSAQQGFEVRTHDISHFYMQGPDWRIRTGLPVDACNRLDPRDDLFESRDLGSCLASDQLIELVRECVRVSGTESIWEQEGAQLDLDGHRRLTIRAPAAVHEQVEKFLDYLRGVFVRFVEVDVYSVKAETLAGPEALTVVTDDVFRRLVAGADSSFVGRTTFPCGRSGNLRLSDRSLYLADYDVEVAHDSEIADPAMRVLECGGDFRFWVDPTADGRFHVRAATIASNLESFRTFDPNSTWVGRLQLPIVDSMMVVGSTVLASGQAMILGTAESGKDECYLVRVSCPSAPKPSNPMWRTLIPMGSAGREVLRLPRIDLGRLKPSGGDEEPDGEEADTGPIFELDRLVGVLTQNQQNQESGDPEGSFVVIQSYLGVKGNEATLESVRESVRQRVDSVHKTAVVEVRVGRISPEDMKKVTIGQLALPDLAGRLQSRSVIPARVGDEFLALNGRERAYVFDHNVEIAQEAGIADPEIRTVFSGILLRGVVSGGPSTGFQFSGEFQLQDVVGDIVSFDGNAKDIGLVETPRTTGTRARLTTTLKPATWTVLHLVSNSQGGDGLVVLARIHGD